MKSRRILGVGLAVMAVAVGVAVVAVGGPAALYSARAQVTADVAPEEVVAGFYGWYLEAIDLQAGENPLVERSYRSSEFLSEAFVDEVDALLDSFHHGGYDPFLLAQDVPVEVAVGEWPSGTGLELVGDEALVIVEMFWGGNPEPSERLVSLKRIDGDWKIVDVALQAE